MEITYQIGDIGPADGTIFYAKGTLIDGWQYLEAAPVTSEFIAKWEASKRKVPNTKEEIGFGKQNTQLILDRLRVLVETNCAAQICASMEINGYKDWFLPSKDELNLMYINLKQKGLGDFENIFYWSSSQYDNSHACGQDFSDGFLCYSTKRATGSVRAIRTF
jgi:hypothetical protein